jgi:hypothetical protein
MNLFLRVAKGKQAGKLIPIKEMLFMIGSDSSCQLRSRLDGILPQHCAIRSDDRKVFILNLGDGQVTVNDEPLSSGEEWRLHRQDRLAVGPLEFVVQFNEAEVPRRDTEDWALKALDIDADKEDQEYVNIFGEVREVEPDTAAATAEAILAKLKEERGIVKGRLRVSGESGTLVIRFNDPHLVEPGEIALIKKELLDNVSGEALRVLLDFKSVRRISAVATKELIYDLRGRVRRQGGALAVCRLHPDLLPILTALQTKKPIPYFNDKRQAISASW